MIFAEAKGLKAVSQTETLREKLYSVLEEYCKQNYPDQPGRFAKLLLRLPALRSIGLKCLEHLFCNILIGDGKRDAIGNYNDELCFCLLIFMFINVCLLIFMFINVYFSYRQFHIGNVGSSKRFLNKLIIVTSFSTSRCHVTVYLVTRRIT